MLTKIKKNLVRVIRLLLTSRLFKLVSPSKSQVSMQHTPCSLLDRNSNISAGTVSLFDKCTKSPTRISFQAIFLYRSDSLQKTKGEQTFSILYHISIYCIYTIYKHKKTIISVYIYSSLSNYSQYLVIPYQRDYHIYILYQNDVNHFDKIVKSTVSVNSNFHCDDQFRFLRIVLIHNSISSRIKQKHLIIKWEKHILNFIIII